MSRYTRADFNAAGLEPNEKCDGSPFNGGPFEPETEDSYWFPCQYHEGYIDGFDVRGYQVAKLLTIIEEARAVVTDADETPEMIRLFLILDRGLEEK